MTRQLVSLLGRIASDAKVPERTAELRKIRWASARPARANVSSMRLAFGALACCCYACSPCDAEFGFILKVLGSSGDADTLRVDLQTESETRTQSFPLSGQLEDGETSLGIEVSPPPPPDSSLSVKVEVTKDGVTRARGATTISASNEACAELLVQLSAAGCGDGWTDTEEGCDDGNAIDADGCTSCQVDSGFTCSGSPSKCSSCTTDCQLSTVFVSSASPCPGEGSAASPFCSITLGVESGAATVITQAGLYEESVVVRRSIELQGDGAPRVAAPTGASALLVGGGARVRVFGISFSARNGDAIVVEDAGTRLELVASTVGPSDRNGLTLRTGASLSISRSRVAGAARGGLELDSAGGFVVEDSVLTGNGGAAGGSGFGAVAVRQASGDSKIAGSTIFSNSNERGAGGVECDVPVLVVNSIVWDNSGNDSGLSGCVAEFCDLGDQDQAGPGNFSENPQLTDDGHLTNGSPCVDRADPSRSTPVDLDGETRPRGAGPDIGADEL
ncbi:MAG: hypothetical protein HY791_19915 [Deltaproteobacteria bacterium]|nr:hypothetical protein [Deltaproteobacteria bacterium]